MLDDLNGCCSIIIWNGRPVNVIWGFEAWLIIRLCHHALFFINHGRHQNLRDSKTRVMQQWMTIFTQLSVTIQGTIGWNVSLNWDTTQLKKLVRPENFRHNPMPDPDDRGWSPDSMDEGLQGSKDVSDRSLGYFWRKNRNFNWSGFLLPGLESLNCMTVGQGADVVTT